MAAVTSSVLIHCEVAIAYPTPLSQPLTAPHPAGTDLWTFARTPAGGGANTGDNSASPTPGLAITWSIPSPEDGAHHLEICKFSPSGAVSRRGGAQRITFHSSLFPGAAVSTLVEGTSGSDTPCFLYALTSDAVVHRIRLHSGASSGFIIRPEQISTVSVAEHAAVIGIPSALVSVGSTLCISGSSGGTLCIPDAAFNGGACTLQQTICTLPGQTHPYNSYVFIRYEHIFRCMMTLHATTSISSFFFFSP